MEVGFIALGTMGYPIAKNIGKKYKLYVWDERNHISKKHSNETGSINCTNINELVEKSDIIFTCLPSSNEVLEITNNFKKSNKLKYLIDCTSGDPEVTLKIGKNLIEKNIYMLDAPVSGGVIKAEKGNLCCMVGGKKEYYLWAKSIFDTFSISNYVGDLGSGHTLKAVNNILNVSHLCMAMEAINSLKKYNINHETAIETINSSSGRCLMTMERIPNHILTQKYNYGFKLGLMKKDVSIGIQIIGKKNKMFNNIEEIMKNGVENLGFDADYTEISKLF